MSFNYARISRTGLFFVRMGRLAKRAWPTFQEYRQVFVVLAGLSLLIEGSKLATMAFLGSLLEGNDDGQMFILSAALMASFMVLRSVCSYGHLLYPMQRHIYMEGLRKLADLSISRVISEDLVSVCSKIKAGQEALSGSVERIFSDLVPIFWGLAIVVPGLFIEHWLLGAIGIVGFAFYVWETFRLNADTFYQAQKHHWQERDVDRRYFDVVDKFELIKSTNEERATLGRLDGELKSYCDEGVRIWTKFFFRALHGKDAISIVCLAGLTLVSLWLRNRGAIGTQGASRSIIWSLSMFYSMSGLGNMQRTLMQYSQAIRNYYAYLDIEHATKRVAVERDGKLDLVGEIVFDHVTCRALKDVSVRIPKGKRIAIVGESGAGKTTFVRVLAGHYDNYQGTVTINGHDVRSIDHKELFQKLKFLPQDPQFLLDTVRKNLTLGLNGYAQAITNDDLRAAADKFHIPPWLLTDKMLDEVIGVTFKPSGGEKQRLALTRAMLTKPSILILDEPTSALDHQSDAHVRLAIARANKSCTTIIIAHKLATAREADIVIVMHKGQIVGMGKHTDLIKTCERYNWLVEKEEESMRIPDEN